MSGEEQERGEVGAAAAAPVPGWGWTETALAVMVLVWGVNFAVVKRALEVFHPLAFNPLRFVIASLFVATVLRARRGLILPAREDVPRVVLLGVMGNFIYQLLFITGLSRTQAGTASLILALTPVLTALLSTLTGHERPGARTWIGAALSIGGVALVTGTGISHQGPDALVGDLILIGASVCWALYTVGARPIVRRYGSVATTAWTMWMGTTGLLLVGIPALSEQRWDVGWQAWGGLLFSALFSIGLAYLIWYRGVEKLGNTRTAIFSNLTPVVAMLAAAVLIGERPTAWALLGAALTLTGVMVVRSDPGQAQRPV